MWSLNIFFFIEFNVNFNIMQLLKIYIVAETSIIIVRKEVL